MRLKLPQRIGLARLSILGVIVGLVTGVGAVLFRSLIGLLHNIAFLGRFEIAYEANLFTPSSSWFPCSAGWLSRF